MNDNTEPGIVEFFLDLDRQEVHRRAEIVRALGDDWDPAETLRAEQEAYTMLYSGLDADQQRVYDELVAAGVLPEQEWPDRAA